MTFVHVIGVLLCAPVIYSKTISSYSCFPCRCLPDSQYGGINSVCTGLNLNSVPRTLNKETTTLRLDHNQLRWIPGKTFIRIRKIKHLDLSHNHIGVLSKDVFCGLLQLEYLNLDFNRIFSFCLSFFNPNFLKPLQNLKTLSILNQVNHCLITTRAIIVYHGDSFPKSINRLYIDCQQCRFSSSFLNLTNLYHLSFVSDSYPNFCYMFVLSSETFQYLPNLRTLNMCQCRVSYIRPGVYTSLKHLQKVDISLQIKNDDTNEFDVFVDATKSFQNLPIEYIRFRGFKNVETDPTIFLLLQNTPLRELHFDSILYPLIHANTFSNLPRSLEVISFRHVQYSGLDVLQELQNLPLLRTIDLSDMVLPGYLTYMPTVAILPPNASIFICKNCNCASFLGSVENVTNGVFPYVPPSIRIKHVRKIDLSGNRIEYMSPSITRDLVSIENIDLSNNLLRGVYPHIFLPNNTISYLNLASNRIGNFLQTNYTNIFETLSKLIFLDLSDNGVVKLPTDVFQYCQHLQVINISNNNLETMDVRLLHLVDLEILDLRGNKLPDIRTTTRNDLEKLPKATVLLSGNPLVCGCEELDFLQWVKDNTFRVHNVSALRCRLSSGQHETLNHLDQIITNLEKVCKSDVVEISTSVSVVVCIVALAVGIAGYRHRWKLRYLYYVGRRGYRRRYVPGDDNIEELYQYDAFVSYADEDRRFVIEEMLTELEEKRNVKLCIHHRDFLPGELISANIVNTIQNSRKTLVVLSPSFLQSNWCEFEYNMARMEGVSRRQEVVLVLLYEEVAMKDVSKDMTTLLRRNCYIEYNSDAFRKDVFWDNVAESIRLARPTD